MKKQMMILASFLLAGVVGMNASHATTNHDGEILATLIAANENEIAGADLALKNATNADVKNYAEMLKTQHSENLKDTLLVKDKTSINPDNTFAVKKLQKKGKMEAKLLSKLSGSKFDKAYINAMVKDHREVLSTIDNKLMKTVKNDSVKELLVATRPHIAAHLEEAQKIQKSLK